MEMVLSSDASIMDRTLGPTEKDFIQGTHLACGDTRQLSTVDGTHLRGKLKKKRAGVEGRLFPGSGSEQTAWLRRAKGPHQEGEVYVLQFSFDFQACIQRGHDFSRPSVP